MTLDDANCLSGAAWRNVLAFFSSAFCKKGEKQVDKTDLLLGCLEVLSSRLGRSTTMEHFDHPNRNATMDKIVQDNLLRLGALNDSLV